MEGGIDGAADDAFVAVDSETSDAFAEAASPEGDGAALDGNPSDAPGDAAHVAPPYDAGDGLVPLDELPLWSPQEDHDGCSCRLGARRGTEGAVVAGSCILAAFVLFRRRRAAG